MNLNEKVSSAYDKAKKWYSGDDKFVAVDSLLEFAGLMDSSDRTLVNVYPSANREGYWFRRALRPEEQHGGFGPYWSSDFSQTGWVFETVWQTNVEAKTFSFCDIHQHLKLRGDLYPPDYYLLKDKWFDNALKQVSEQQKQNPEVKFLVSGVSGLLPYHYYLNRRHYGRYKDEVNNPYLFPWTKGMVG